MKKMKNWMIMLIMIMTAGFLTSCEEDNKLAFRLDGEWRGDFGMNYTVEHNGRLYTFDSYDTYLVFYNDGFMYSTHGWGKQVDYYDYGPYEYQYYKFYWYIRDGVIYLTYPRNPELEVAIYDYRMSFSHFSGWFGNSDVSFNLRKLDCDYNWDYYYNDYCYGWNNTWSWGYYPYYSKTRTITDNAEIKADTVETKDVTLVTKAATGETKANEEFHVVSIGNRYMNNLKNDK